MEDLSGKIEDGSRKERKGPISTEPLLPIEAVVVFHVFRHTLDGIHSTRNAGAFLCLTVDAPPLLRLLPLHSHPAVFTFPPVFATPPFRDAEGIGETSSIKPQPSSTIVVHTTMTVPQGSPPFLVEDGLRVLRFSLSSPQMPIMPKSEMVEASPLDYRCYTCK